MQNWLEDFLDDNFHYAVLNAPSEYGVEAYDKNEWIEGFLDIIRKIAPSGSLVSLLIYVFSAFGISKKKQMYVIPTPLKKNKAFPWI